MNTPHIITADMIIKSADRQMEYRSPITEWTIWNCGSIIAQSSLENPGEGDEWVWED